VDGVNGFLLVVRFALELAALAALTVCGFTTGDGAAARWVLGIAAPAAAIGIWWTFVAPKSPIGTPP